MGIPRIEWPIPPRPGQEEVAGRLAELLANGKRVLLSAPTGWGKTMTVLAALKTGDLLPAVWLGRSLSLGKRVGDDAAFWNLRTFTSAGREKTCPLTDKLGSAVHDFCKYMRYRCPYARLPPFSSLPLVASSYIELVKIGKRERWCPYYAQDFAEADIYVQSYFRKMNQARCVVVDEAHNLLMPREAHISLFKLAEGAAALREAGASDRLLSAVESLVRYLTVKDGALEISLFLSENEVNELRELYLERLREGDARLRPLLELTKGVVYVEGEKVLVFKPEGLPSFRPSVLVSATMPEVGENILQIDAEIKIPWTKKLKAAIVDDVTTKFDEFNTHMVLRYKKLLVDVARNYERVLVFAASERVARELISLATYYEAEPPLDWKGILLLKARGRFGEGVDLPADAVIMAGAPFLPPEVSDRLARMYRAAGMKAPLKAAVDIPMLTTTLQCIGRAWRRPDTEPAVFLADSRFSKYVKNLENYVEIR